MSTETENTSCNSLAEYCAVNGIKQTSVFTAVKEAIISRLGYKNMNQELQNVLSETAGKHTEIMKSNEEVSASETAENQQNLQVVSIPPEEIPEPVNDPNVDVGEKNAA